jgi:hypothetical protein
MKTLNTHIEITETSITLKGEGEGIRMGENCLIRW